MTVLLCNACDVARADWALRWSWGIFLDKVQSHEFWLRRAKAGKKIRCLCGRRSIALFWNQGCSEPLSWALFFSSQANWVNQCISIFPYRPMKHQPPSWSVISLARIAKESSTAVWWCATFFFLKLCVFFTELHEYAFQDRLCNVQCDFSSWVVGRQ